MILELFNKVLVVFLFMAILSVIRHVYFFAQAYFTSTEEEPVKYRLTEKALVYLCLSLAYILSAIFTGIKL